MKRKLTWYAVNADARRKAAALRRSRLPARRRYLPRRLYGPLPGFTAVRGNAPERKYIDGIISGATNYNIDPLQLINGASQGAGVSQRIGRTMMMRSIQCRISLRTPQIVTTADPFNSMSRFMIIYDKQTNGAVPLASTVLSNVYTVGPVPIHPTAFMNLGNRGRFKIIMDEVRWVGYSLPVANIYFYKKVNLETVFQSDGGGIADISTGGLFFLWWDQNGVAVGDNTMTFSVRTRFTDT